MDLSSAIDLKEQQKINELERKIKLEKTKLDKKLTRQKILLGTFMIDMLEGNKVDGLAKYTAANLNEFLTRENDRKLMDTIINSLQNQLEEDENIRY